MVSAVIEAVGRLVDEERLGASVACVTGPAAGSRAVIEAGVGYLAGSIPDEVAGDVLADAAALMALSLIHI